MPSLQGQRLGSSICLLNIYHWTDMTKIQVEHAVGGLISVARSRQSWTFTYMLPHFCPVLLVLVSVVPPIFGTTAPLPPLYLHKRIYVACNPGNDHSRESSVHSGECRTCSILGIFAELFLGLVDIRYRFGEVFWLLVPVI